MWDIELRKALFIRDIIILKNVFKFNEDNYIILKLIQFILENGKEVEDKNNYVELNNNNNLKERNSIEIEFSNQAQSQNAENNIIRTENTEDIIQVESPARSSEYYAEFIRPENELLYTIENTILFNIIGGFNNVSQKAKYVLTSTTIESNSYKQTEKSPQFHY